MGCGKELPCQRDAVAILQFADEAENEFVLKLTAGISVHILTVVADGNTVQIISITVQVNAATAFLSWSRQSDTITLEMTVSRCQTITVYNDTCR